MNEVVMMYKPIKESRILIENVERILDKSDEKLTLRALFYKLVSRNVLDNNVAGYKRLSIVLNKARKSGILNYDCIEDRIRTNIFPSFYDDVNHLLKTALENYKIDIWENQDNYIEILVEKDTLVSALEDIVRTYKVNLSVNKGYTSLTELYHLAKRLDEKKDKNCCILYVGDLDPSGLDMDRDIQERLNDFGVNYEFMRVALTKDDVDKYELLPNRIKKQDPRSKKYPYDDCWEVDAMDPKTLKVILVSLIESLINYEEWNESKRLENNSIDEIKKKFGM